MRDPLQVLLVQDDAADARSPRETQAEAGLLAAHQMRFRDEYLSHVSHELRSPLNAIYQFVTILLDGLARDLNPKQSAHLAIVLRNIEHLQSAPAIDDQ
ncbi:MAG: histidine kinase dimerization/phospho-acceptor domain-containing protein [Acidobacteriaceae bacterium]